MTLRPSTIRLTDGDFRIDGELDAKVGSQLGRYRIRVRIKDVDGFDLRDRAQTDTILVREFVPVKGGLRFASKVLTEVVVRGAGSVVEVIRASAPFSVRRFLRWRFESDAPTVYVHEGPESAATTYSIELDELPHVVGLDRRERGDAQLVAAELAVGLGVDDAVLAQGRRDGGGIDASRRSRS